MAPRKRTDKVHEYDAAMYHLILLCRNEVGYRNLCFLDSAAFTEGFYIRPRIDKELLRQHAEGLIALSACQSGEVPRKLLAGDYEGAKAAALEMRALFGEDGYYLELQDHKLPNDRHQPGLHPHPPGDGHPPGGDQRRPLSPPGGRGDGISNCTRP